MTINNTSIEDRIFLVHEVIHKKKSVSLVSRENDIGIKTLSDWVWKYQKFGEEAIHPYKKRYKYTERDKKSAVEEVLFDGASKGSVLKKYNISTKSVLLAWISNYNSKKELKDTGRGLSKMKNRQPSKKTSIKERIEIVQYTLAHNTDYQAAIEKYGVSYQQIYTWVRKYNSLGIKGLQDKRGRNQPFEDLSELDKLKLENKQLRSRNNFLEMEQDFTKKLHELRRRSKNFR